MCVCVCVCVWFSPTILYCFALNPIALFSGFGVFQHVTALKGVFKDHVYSSTVCISVYVSPFYTFV